MQNGDERLAKIAHLSKKMIDSDKKRIRWNKILTTACLVYIIVLIVDIIMRVAT